MNRLRHFVRQHPVLRSRMVSFLRNMQWQRHVFNDWWTTIFSKTKTNIQTPFGFSLVAEGYLANRMMQKGIFEPEETIVIREQLESTQVFVDIGANIGFYTCLARIMGKSAIAIEPQPRNLECLYANLFNNNMADTEVFPLGLHSRPGLGTLYGASGPSASLLDNWAGYSKRYRQTISLSTLDNVLGTRWLGKHLLIKIDVEGAEYQVLSGAIQTIRMSPAPVWMVEICLSEYHPTGINPYFAKTFELFWQYDYEARTADQHRRLITREQVNRWSETGQSESGTINYIFVMRPHKEL